MKCLLIAESRDGKLLDSIYELLGFSAHLEAESAIFMVGGENPLPAWHGRLFLADAAQYGEYNPALHRELIITAVRHYQPDHIVFSHSSYGWDLAPRVAANLGTAQLTEVSAVTAAGFLVPCLNGKMRRTVKPMTTPAVLTIQAGAFTPLKPGGIPRVERLETTGNGATEFLGYEVAEADAMGLDRARVIVAAGRGVGKRENMPAIAALARALGGEVAATRPVTDAGWVEKWRQVGATGQTVAPGLYVACGISGAVQHLAGMKQSEFIVAINRDREAPIAEVADVLAVADVMQLVPALIKRLSG